LLGISADNVDQDFDGHVTWMVEYAKLRSAGVDQDDAVKQALQPALIEEDGDNE